MLAGNFTGMLLSFVKPAASEPICSISLIARSGHCISVCGVDVDMTDRRIGSDVSTQMNSQAETTNMWGVFCDTVSLEYRTGSALPSLRQKTELTRVVGLSKSQRMPPMSLEEGERRGNYSPNPNLLSPFRLFFW